MCLRRMHGLYSSRGRSYKGCIIQRRKKVYPSESKSELYELDVQDTEVTSGAKSVDVHGSLCDVTGGGSGGGQGDEQVGRAETVEVKVPVLIAPHLGRHGPGQHVDVLGGGEREGRVGLVQESESVGAGNGQVTTSTMDTVA